MTLLNLTRGAVDRIFRIKHLHVLVQPSGSLGKKLNEMLMELHRVETERDETRERFRQADAARTAAEERLALVEKSHMIARRSLQGEAKLLEELRSIQAKCDELKADAATERDQLMKAKDELEIKLYIATSDAQRAAVLNDELMRDLREARSERKFIVEQEGRGFDRPAGPRLQVNEITYYGAPRK